MVTLATVSVAMSLATAAQSLPDGPTGVVRSFVPFLGGHRRRGTHGRVVEEGTGFPVGGAIINLLNATGKPLDTIRTKSDGTFSALLPSGTYQLLVTTSAYELVPHPRLPALFPEETLYTGGLITVGAAELLPPLVIVLRSRTTTRGIARSVRFRARLETLYAIQAQLAIPLILAGALFNTLLLVEQPSRLLVLYEVLYGVLLGVEFLLLRVAPRSIGWVRDILQKTPVALAMVRLVDARTKRLVATRITSPRGQFLLMPPPGAYHLQVAHRGYRPFTNERFRVGSGIAGALTGRAAVALEPLANAKGSGTLS